MPSIHHHFVFLLLLSTAPGAALSDETKPIETIEVTGKKPLQLYFSLREEKRHAFMRYFNEIVQDDDLKFECKRVAPKGTRVWREVCKSAFDWRIEKEIVDEEISRGNMLGAERVAKMGNKEQRDRKKELTQTIKTMLATNEEFAEYWKHFKAADENFKNAHSKAFGSLSMYSEEDESAEDRESAP
ncbi:hypothetical protein HHX48_12465 [Salinimonas sp. HHU 13199]|uniref:Uncharacterized protein n=1 Tax=Salinimonas profundi TaxID=2729140 RepID=A0ABR8LLD8_9ALTE|nr:hypothetical protein [Salinimonas profundi]MBD3586552.1 hypothetical protein [Salinimonas profundi]